MLSFHNDIKVKKKYLERVRRHSKLGNIVQNRRWKDGKGGAVGCTLENYDHSRYPIELGLPEWLARIEDKIFEGLPVDEAKRWPEKFLEAIPVGVDTEIVRHQLAVRRMDRLIKLQEELLVKRDRLKSVIKKIIAAINMVKTCHEAEVNKTVCEISFADAELSARAAAMSAVRSAVRSAEWAAEWSSEGEAMSVEWLAALSAMLALSAEWSAWSSELSAAESAWLSARAAWSVARAATMSAAAARSAESALSAAAAARSAAWKQEADDLLELLANLKSNNKKC